jgi:prepilin-type N-terminal cleavage/methylation domain-containing protein
MQALRKEMYCCDLSRPLITELPTPMNIKLLENQLPASRSRGFTLIELMVTVAIVAILTSIAYPSYRNYVIRGQVVEATQSLSTLRANLERFYQDSRSYNDVGAIVSPCSNTSNTAHFTVTCAVTVPGFTATATGNAGLTGFVYTVDQADTQVTAITSPAPSAWLINCNSSWSTKAGSC